MVARARAGDGDGDGIEEQPSSLPEQRYGSTEGTVRL